MKGIQIFLASIEQEQHDAWQRFCGDLEGVTVHYGSILHLNCDAVLSPANSFGFMDGGVGMLYRRHFGWRVQDRLQKRIRERHYGELVVGAAEIVETTLASGSWAHSVRLWSVATGEEIRSFPAGIK